MRVSKEEDWDLGGNGKGNVKNEHGGQRQRTGQQGATAMFDFVVIPIVEGARPCHESQHLHVHDHNPSLLFHWLVSFSSLVFN